jgi:hypothetical protein
MTRSGNRELRTIEAMVKIYCRYHHKEDHCKECVELLLYASARIEKCVLVPGKPACKNCEVHCYSPKMREKIIKIMRFSGPKMIFKHPVMALFHIITEKQFNYLFHQQINQ